MKSLALWTDLQPLIAWISAEFVSEVLKKFSVDKTEVVRQKLEEAEG